VDGIEHTMTGVYTHNEMQLSMHIL